MKQYQHRNKKEPGRSRKRKKPRINKRALLCAVGLLLAILAAMVCILYFKEASQTREGEIQDNRIATQNNAVENTVENEAAAAHAEVSDTDVPDTETSSDAVQTEIQAVIDSYSNLGLVDVSGYLNVRTEANVDGEIIGRLPQYGACEILGIEGEWSHIRSGEVEGYVNNQYILTGEEAERAAVSQVKLMAVVTADSLNIRSEPVQNPANVTGAASANERYEVRNQEDGWIQINEGYISAEYAQVRYALEEATKLDLKEMAINRYENLVISRVSNYLNVRSSPENQGDSNIIGKLPGRAAGEILETVDGWYHIQSGSING